VYRYDEQMRRKSKNVSITGKPIPTRKSELPPPSLGCFYDENQGIMKTFQTPGENSPTNWLSTPKGF
jgi:hypothetical protein